MGEQKHRARLAASQSSTLRRIDTGEQSLPNGLTSKYRGRKNRNLTVDDLEELRTFLRDHVSGFEELEVLLFMARSSGRVWSIPEVAKSLNLAEELTGGALEALAKNDKLLQRSSGVAGSPAFRYAPAPELQPLLTELQRAYDEERLNIVQIMSSNAVERVRSSAARRLADAFRLDRSKK